MKCSHCNSDKTYLFAIMKNGNTGNTREVYDCYDCHKRTTVEN